MVERLETNHIDCLVSPYLCCKNEVDSEINRMYLVLGGRKDRKERSLYLELRGNQLVLLSRPFSYFKYLLSVSQIYLCGRVISWVSSFQTAKRTCGTWH